VPQHKDFERYSHLILDGTYFHKDGCFMTLMNASDQVSLSNTYVPKEGFTSAFSWFSNLKQKRLNPYTVTSDGEISVLRALRITWPSVKIQRCLYHIQHEGCRWLRSQPKTQAALALRRILKGLCAIRSVKEQKQFVASYMAWLKQYRTFVYSLPDTVKANKDIKRTINLLNNALPNMFHYLMDPQIHSTTNALEGWHSRIKRAYRQHAGLNQRHKIQFLRWFSYFNDQQKTNNL
jgi:hypothetical protein